MEKINGNPHEKHTWKTTQISQIKLLKPWNSGNGKSKPGMFERKWKKQWKYENHTWKTTRSLCLNGNTKRGNSGSSFSQCVNGNTAIYFFVCPIYFLIWLQVAAKCPNVVADLSCGELFVVEFFFRFVFWRRLQLAAKCTIVGADLSCGKFVQNIFYYLVCPIYFLICPNVAAECGSVFC